MSSSKAVKHATVSLAHRRRLLCCLKTIFQDLPKDLQSITTDMSKGFWDNDVLLYIVNATVCGAYHRLEQMHTHR